ncbi:MAG: hypothetical protein ACP5IK_00910 [Candidatus Micrarchaeia archaeon]
MNKIGTTLLVFAFLASSATLANAQQIAGETVCNAMFNADNLSVLSASYATLLNVSLVIVLMVLSLLSIIYAIGRAFGLARLVSFVQKEYLESIFNIILITIVIGGLGFADASAKFFASISAIYATSPPSIPNTANGLLLQLCTNYFNNGAYQALRDVVYLLPAFATGSFLDTLTFQLNTPQGANVTLHRVIPAPVGISIGFSISPFKGVSPYLIILKTEADVAVGIAMILIGVGMLLAFIAALFPLLFYAGILLRSFPWMRAAGGSLIALFISFYIVFPGIAYGASILQNAIPSPPQLQGFGTLAAILTAITNPLEVLILHLMPQIENTINTFIYSVIQIFAIGVAFLISFDLLEALGDLLGAPSLQSSKLFSKVI